VQYNHDRLIIVKRRPEKYSLQLATQRSQRRCIPDRWIFYLIGWKCAAHVL